MAFSLIQSVHNADERLYLRARLVVNTLVIVLTIIPPPGVPTTHRMLSAILALIMSIDTILLFSAAKRDELARWMMIVLVPDLVAVAGYTWLYLGFRDGFYPVAIMLPVAYALVVPLGDAWIVGGATSFAYLVARVVAQPITGSSLFFTLLKAAAITLVAGMVAVSVDKQRRFERQLSRTVEQREVLTEQMRRRISELQAVSEITEIVHSSLDFERVGPLVLEILGKALGIERCALFVIDKSDSNTVFSASIGQTEGRAEITYDDIELENVPHFSCISVYDHSDIMVLFCSSTEQIESITSEDRLVLGAVASEIVVAVENARLYKLTKKLAVTDELTGLYNYRYLQQKLDEELERSRRYDKRLSLLMIDVDDFKLFNDSYGHIAGDHALADLGCVVRQSVREVDIVARYGGEEFSVILPETDAAGAFVTAEKIREAVSNHLFGNEDGTPCCSMSISVGLASFPAHAWDKESLLREADDALYNAKHGGKNRVRAPKQRLSHTKPAPDNDQDSEATSATDEWTGA